MADRVGSFPPLFLFFGNENNRFFPALTFFPFSMQSDAPRAIFVSSEEEQEYALHIVPLNGVKNVALSGSVHQSYDTNLWHMKPACGVMFHCCTYTISCTSPSRGDISGPINKRFLCRSLIFFRPFRVFKKDSPKERSNSCSI